MPFFLDERQFIVDYSDVAVILYLFPLRVGFLFAGNTEIFLHFDRDFLRMRLLREADISFITPGRQFVVVF